MPTQWQPYVLGHDLDVSTVFDRHGSVKYADVEVVYNEERFHSEAEYEDQPKYRKNRLDYDEKEDAYREYGNGASATFRFKPDDAGRMRVESVTDISTGRGDRHNFRFLRLLHSANEAIASLPTVDGVVPPREVVLSQIEAGDGVEIVE